MPHRSAGRAVLVSFLAAAMAAMTALILVRALHSYQDAVQWQSHTYEVLNSLNETRAGVRDAEAWAYRYLASGGKDTACLPPYRAGASRAEARLSQLATLTNDNPSQKERIIALASAVADRLSAAHAAVQAKEKVVEGLPVWGRPGNETDDIIDAAKMEEYRLLDARSSEVRDQAWRAMAYLLAGQALTMILNAVAAALARVEAAAREQNLRELAEVRKWTRSVQSGQGLPPSQP